MFMYICMSFISHSMTCHYIFQYNLLVETLLTSFNSKLSSWWCKQRLSCSKQDSIQTQEFWSVMPLKSLNQEYGSQMDCPWLPASPGVWLQVMNRASLSLGVYVVHSVKHLSGRIFPLHGFGSTQLYSPFLVFHVYSTWYLVLFLVFSLLTLSRF